MKKKKVVMIVLIISGFGLFYMLKSQKEEGLEIRNQESFFYLEKDTLEISYRYGEDQKEMPYTKLKTSDRNEGEES